MKVLFITHRLPYAPNRGDRVRAYFMLRYLRSRMDVDVVSLVHDRDEASHAGELRGWASSVRTARVAKLRNLVRGVASLASDVPMTHAMLDSPELSPAIAAAISARRPDVVLAYCSGMARLALAPPLRDIPFVLDMVDVDSAKWRDLAEVSLFPRSWIYRRESRLLGAFEARAAREAMSTLVVTPREHDTLRAIAPAGRIEVVPNGVDVASLRPSGAAPDSADVVFCGVMNYAPNEHAAVQLAREIWPLVRRSRPDATLTIVGSHPTPAVRRLADAAGGISVTGSVPDVRPYLWRAALSAAPILTARGIQNKVLEAVAAGLPTVVTPNIAAALPREILPAIVSATGPEALAAQILRLLGLPARERRAMAERADVDALDWDRQLGAVEGLLQAAAAREQPAHVGAAS